MMRLSDPFDVQGNISDGQRKIFTVEFDDGTCSDVMLLVDTGLMYVMQCADGKIAYDAEGKTHSPSVSEYDIVEFVKARLAAMPAYYTVTVRRYSTCEVFDSFEGLVHGVRKHFIPKEKPIVERLLNFSKTPFVNLHWTNSYQDISVSKHIKNKEEIP